MASLGHNRYGKSGIRLVKVDRQGQRHDVSDLLVSIALEGSFESAHRAGDNARILPTDTMKNTVYALAREHSSNSIEEFALHLSEHFLGSSAHVTRARIHVHEYLWRRIQVAKQGHDHAFARATNAERTTRIVRSRKHTSVRGGVRQLELLKTAGSAFAGFIKDKYTTLAETDDRILATSVNAEWQYGRTDVVYNDEWQRAVDAIEQTFAAHDSQSVQHTLYAMGEAVLDRCASIQSVRFKLPNRHHILVDLSRFGLDNRNQIFVATREPYGLIEGVVERRGNAGKQESGKAGKQ